MSKKEDGTSTATRVKAFRDRLSSSSYKRVEGYVTTEEKARVDAVKAQLGVTTDVAVAGLLRMGLEQFERTEQLQGLTRLQSPVIAGVTGARPADSPMLALVKLKDGCERPAYVAERMKMSANIFSAEVSTEILRQLENDPAVLSVALSGPVMSAARSAIGAVAPPDLFTAEMESGISQAPVVTQGLAMLGGGSLSLNGLPAELMSFTGSNAGNLAVSASACVDASLQSLNMSSGANAMPDNDNNPISRFFKHRKEMNKNV